jgi:serine/threonine protein kinase
VSLALFSLPGRILGQKGREALTMGNEKEETCAAGPVAQSDTFFQSGDVLRNGRYEIDRLLGPGLEKAVYLAHDQMLGCPVALDVIPNDALMPSGLTVSAWETLVLGQLGDHRNIGTVLERWDEAGAAFMVSRYLSGGSLRDLIERRRESGEPLHASRGDHALGYRNLSRIGAYSRARNVVP